jgi:hypothetical protein
MTDHDRVRLLFGPYRTPRFKYGDVVFCEKRGSVKIVGLTNALIPWPKCRTGKRSRAIILHGALADAVRREAALAVAHWWGVGLFTVWKWRKALGVGPITAGTRRLKHDYALEPAITAARARAWAKAGDAVRRRKIADSRRGKPRPPHVIEALRRANTGRKLSIKTRVKMSLVHHLRGTWPPKAGKPWKKWEDRLLRNLPVIEVARRTRRTLKAVYARRKVLRLPDGRAR